MYLGQLVEVGRTADVLDEPRHPYTQMLVNAVPRLMRAIPAPPVEADLPSNTVLPTGCFFADRCIHRKKGCESKQTFSQVGAHHLVRCWRAEELRGSQAVARAEAQ
jgi:peptide/nickel transport system ATP-binding protein